MGLCFSSLSPPAPHSSSSLNRPPQYSGSTSTDSNNVGFSATTSSARKTQFSDIASGNVDCEGSLPLPLPSPNGQILERPNLKVFSFEDLKSATNNFGPDTLLSVGGFDRIYKGWLDEKTLTPTRAGSGMVVAIKKLNPHMGQGFRQWQSEVNFLGRLSHPNLIKLLGYCWDDEELLIVYEFMPNGNLGNHLFKASNPNIEPLSWNARIKIAIGAARGLAFLHTSEKQVVIHRDFRASNILLDGNYNAKITDFSLAKLGPTGGESHVNTSIMGTFGYMATEYIATGMQVLDPRQPTVQQNLVDLVNCPLSVKMKMKTIMDAKIEGQYSQEAAFRALQLSLKCRGPDPDLRPSIKDVLEALEAIEDIQVKFEESKNLNSHYLHFMPDRVVRI